jgi:hypothetical protein
MPVLGPSDQSLKWMMRDSTAASNMEKSMSPTMTMSGLNPISRMRLACSAKLIQK